MRETDAVTGADPQRSLLQTPCSINGNKALAIIDTGAAISAMSKTFAESLELPLNLILKTAGGHLLRPPGSVTVDLRVLHSRDLCKFLVVANLPADVLLGIDWCRRQQVTLDFSSNPNLSIGPHIKQYTGPAEAGHKIIEENDNDVHLYQHTLTPVVQPNIITVNVLLSEPILIPPWSEVVVPIISDKPFSGEAILEPSGTTREKQGIAAARALLNFTEGTTNISVANLSWQEQTLYPKTCLGTAEAFEEILQTPQAQPINFFSPHHGPAPKFNIPEHLPQQQKQNLESLLERYDRCFNDVVTGRTNKDTNLPRHRIDTEGRLPVKQTPHRLAFTEREIIKKQIREMLDRDIIRPSNSPWASRVVLVKKKDNTVRFCCDYRSLNAVTRRDVYPLPRIDDALDRLRGANYFSTIDLTSGYWQLEVEESDKEKTAFITPDGLFEFNVMPFGLCNSGATLQRALDSLLAGLTWSTCLVYLDDVILYSKTFQDHLIHLEEVLQRLDYAGLKLKREKCFFAQKSIAYLGHQISKFGIRPDPTKTAAVERFSVPKSRKELKSFLGLCSYYRKFVKNFARIASPLTALTSPKLPFKWGKKEEKAFQELKFNLIRPPILGHFDDTLPTEIHPDACDAGIGAVLVQRRHGLEQVIAYASRTLTPAESSYSATEKECLALIFAVSRFRPYVYGRHVTIITDHHSLCWLLSLKDPHGRLSRWALRMQDQDMTIRHRSGKAHQDADCLSRFSTEPSTKGDSYMEEFPCLMETTQSTRRLQEKDDNLQSIIQFIENPQAETTAAIRRKARHYCLKDATLYKNDAHNPRLCVPRDLRADVLFGAHDDTVAGHMGFKKTYNRLRNRYFWPNLRRSVERYVRSCPDCQTRKPLTSGPQGMLQPIPVPESPFHRIGIDFLGPFPISENGNKHIIVCTEYLSKWAETKAVPNATAEAVAEFFVDQIVYRHGAPKELLSDRGTQFLAEVTTSSLQRMQTLRKRTTAYHPQCNGLTERFNRTLTDMLSMYVSSSQKDWDKSLPAVTFAYNTAVQETTDRSPFAILYGREPTMPMDRVLPTSEPEPPNQADIENERRMAAAQIIQKQEKQSKRYNDGRRTVTFDIGEQVYIRKPTRKVGKAEKLLHQFHGPFKVTRKISEVNYEVEVKMNRRRPRLEVIHVQRMKPAFTREANDPETRSSERGSCVTALENSNDNTQCSERVIPLPPKIRKVIPALTRINDPGPGKGRPPASSLGKTSGREAIREASLTGQEIEYSRVLPPVQAGEDSITFRRRRQHAAPDADQHDAPDATQHAVPDAARHATHDPIQRDAPGATQPDAPGATQPDAPDAIQHDPIRHAAHDPIQHDDLDANQHAAHRGAPAPRPHYNLRPRTRV